MTTETQFDKAVEFQLDAMRVSARTQSDVRVILIRMERELLGKLAGPMTEWIRTRIKQQLAEVRAVIASYYDDAANVAAQATNAVGEVAAKITVAGLELGGAAVIMPNAATLEAIVSNAIIQGAVQADWWSRQSSDTAFRFATAVRQGIAAAETNQQIIARVRQEMAVTRANAAALVQTSVATVANDARQAVFDANADIIKRYRAIATLDTHTCSRCAPLDGLEWLPDGTPVGHSTPQPRYPLHYNCRCMMLPIVIDGPREGQRAAAGGPVKASTTFSDWLERQPKSKQEEVLGKGRADLYRAGKITLSDLTSGAGRPLTLAELRSKYA